MCLTPCAINLWSCVVCCIPHSALEITDSVFARLDESDAVLTDFTPDEEATREDERPGETAEDGLDLWSLLYGLG